MGELADRDGSRIYFYAEQNGTREKALKANILSVLSRYPQIERAYLAQISYREHGDRVTALCLYPEVADPAALLAEFDALFIRAFRNGLLLDILSLTPAQDAELRLITSPFHFHYQLFDTNRRDQSLPGIIRFAARVIGWKPT